MGTRPRHWAAALATYASIMALVACGSDATPTPPSEHAPRPRVAVDCDGLYCTFVASDTASDSPIVEYAWAWGDTHTTTTTAASTSHDYAGPGDYTVTLTARNAGGASGSVDVRLDVAIAPAGATVLVDRDWSCLLQLLCDGDWSYSAAASLSASVVSDPSAPRSEPFVGQMLFRAGHVGGTAPAIADRAFAASSRGGMLYVAAWIKFSANWDGHPTGINKILYFSLSGPGAAIYTSAHGAGGAPLVPEIALQSLAEPYFDGVSITATTVNLLPNVNRSVRIVRGQWHRMEYILTSNTPGVSNGRVRGWLDGVPVHDYSGMRFVGAGAPGVWESMQWAPVWGGVDGIVLADMSQRLDHLFVSAR